MLKIHSSTQRNLENDYAPMDDITLEKFDNKIVACIGGKPWTQNHYEIAETRFMYVLARSSLDVLVRTSFEESTICSSTSGGVKIRAPSRGELAQLEQKVKEGKITAQFEEHKSKILEVVMKQFEETAKREFSSNFSVREFS